MKKIFSLLIFLLIQVIVWAKDGEQVNTMRSNGRIYVVVAVILTILIGLVLYIVRIDRKLSRLEKQ